MTELALFGSVLRDDFRPDSDIGVMVQFHPDAHPTFSTLDQMETESYAKNIVWDVVQLEIPPLIEELKSQIPPEPQG